MKTATHSCSPCWDSRACGDVTLVAVVVVVVVIDVEAKVIDGLCLLC